MLGTDTITSFTDTVNTVTGEITNSGPVVTKVPSTPGGAAEKPNPVIPAGVCGDDCSWYQTGIIGADGKCACGFSASNALTTVFLFPGSLLMGMITSKEETVNPTPANTTMITLVSLAAWAGAAYLYWRYKR